MNDNSNSGVFPMILVGLDIAAEEKQKVIVRFKRRVINLGFSQQPDVNPFLFHYMSHVLSFGNSVFTIQPSNVKVGSL
jgi:hypothetical protein